MTQFISASAKITRAEKQTKNLESEIGSFLTGQNYEVRQNLDTETGRKTAVFHVLRNIPIEWPIIVGEILHDLRSALDHAITDLTIAESGKPLEGTEFPVFDDEAKYHTSGLHKVRGVSGRAKAVIQALQPFKLRKSGTIPTLSLLHHLNIIDKHRTIHIFRQITTNIESRTLRDIRPIEMNFPVGEIKHGTKLAEWFSAEESKDEMDMEFKIYFDIALGEIEGNLTAINGKRVVEVCTKCVAGARNILSRLEDCSRP